LAQEDPLEEVFAGVVVAVVHIRPPQGVPIIFLVTEEEKNVLKENPKKDQRDNEEEGVLLQRNTVF